MNPTTESAELPEALPRYREYMHLRTTGAWSSGVPAWARDYSGCMNDMTAAHAVIEELHAQVEALGAAQAGVQWQCGQQANGFTAAPAAGVVRVCPECDIAGCRHMRTAPQPATADALDAMMLDALKHAQKVLNHHNLPLECGPINEAILAAHQGDTQ